MRALARSGRGSDPTGAIYRRRLASPPSTTRRDSPSRARAASSGRTAWTAWTGPTWRSSRGVSPRSDASSNAWGSSTATPSADSVAAALMSVYRSMGDVLAMQYGGSQAHHKAEVARDGGVGPSGAVARVVNRVASGGAKLLTSARRFYSNAYTDADKQEGIDLFLGHHAATRRGDEDDPSAPTCARVRVGGRSRPLGAGEPIASLQWSALEGDGRIRRDGRV